MRLLPWFELCFFVLSAARREQLKVDAFRACWADFAARHADMKSTAGFLLYVGDWDAGEDDLLTVLHELERPPSRAPDPRKDARDRDDDWKEEVLRHRFRALHEMAIRRLSQRFKGKKHWRTYRRLDELPESELVALADSVEGSVPDIVIDTNVLVELLNVLPVRDQSGTRLDLSALDEPFRTRLAPALSGGFGKLIVPVSVLIETEGVIATKGQKYQRADKVLRHLAALPHRARSAAFSFEPMDVDTFAAFLHLIELLIETRVPRERWPALGDALVLAHGIYNRCPVASYEWLNKDHWRRAQLPEVFPYLVLR